MLVADRLQDARVGREAGLAAALLRQAELLEEHRAELLGRADDELLARERPRSRARARRISSPHALVDLGQPVDVQPDAGQLHVAQDVHERQLDVVEQRLQAALGELLALPGGQRADEHRVGGRRVLGVASASPRSSLISSEREAARARARAGRRRAACRGRAAPGRAERLGVVGDHGAVAAARRRRPRGRRRRRPPPPRPRPRRSASPPRGRAARPRGPRARARRARAGRRAGPSAAASCERPLADARRRPSSRPTGAGAAASADPSASSRRRSGSRSSNSRKTSRRRERSGSRPASCERVDVDRDVALDRGQDLRDPRVLGVLAQVLLALGAGDVVDVLEDLLERAVGLQELRRRSCRRSPGRRGCCPTCRP